MWAATIFAKAKLPYSSIPVTQRSVCHRTVAAAIIPTLNAIPNSYAGGGGPQDRGGSWSPAPWSAPPAFTLPTSVGLHRLSWIAAVAFLYAAGTRLPGRVVI